jgi:hypothetical protein
VKRLTSALLILGIFASAALAQPAQQVMKDRHRVLAGWLGTVRAAESKYKSKHGVYGDLAALRDAHLLNALVFDSHKPTETGPDTNLVPESTHFEVTVSSDGEHYYFSIWEILEEWIIGVSGDEVSTGHSVGRRPPPPREDIPEGPLLSLPG